MTVEPRTRRPAAPAPAAVTLGRDLRAAVRRRTRRCASRRTTAARPATRDATLGHPAGQPRGRSSYLATAPGSLGLARAYIQGDLEVEGVHPGDPYELLQAHRRRPARCAARRRRGRAQWLRGARARARFVPPPLPDRRRSARPPARHRPAALPRCATPSAISHHYDVSNTFYEHGARPVDDLHLRLLPDRRTSTLEQAQEHKYDLVARKLGLQPGMRLLDVGCGWGGMVRHAARNYGVQALGVTLSREQATWARSGSRPRASTDLAEVRHLDYRDVTETRLRRGQLDRADRAHRREELPGVLPVPARASCARAAGCSTTASPGRTTSTPGCRGAASSAGTSSPTASSPAPATSCARWRTPASRCSTRRTCGCTTPRRCTAWCANLVGALGRGGRRGRAADREGVGPLHGRLAAGVRAQRHPAAPDPGHEDHAGRGRRGYPLRHDFGV